MEETFTKIISQIFNNWTALKLAVDHSMGGPNSRQSAVDFVNYMVQYCLHEQHVEVEGIQEALEDIMDEEFETICEDESPKQIAQLLYNFLGLLRQGRCEECELEFQKLPSVNGDWLSQPSHMSVMKNESSDSSSDEAPSPQPTPMEEDGWTQVKSRKKR